MSKQKNNSEELSVISRKRQVHLTGFCPQTIDGKLKQPASLPHMDDWGRGKTIRIS